MISLWVDMLAGRLKRGDCALSITNSSTSAGWLHKTIFREFIGENTDSVQSRVRIYIARHHSTLFLKAGIKEYSHSQWFSGWENNAVDALLCDFDCSDDKLTKILRKSCPSQPPQHFQIVPLPNKISSWLGKWSNPTHREWQWFYKKENNNLIQVEGGRAVHSRPARRLRLTQSKVVYQRVYDKEYNSQMLLSCPTSIRAILSTKVNKLQEGPSFANATKEYTIFWDFIGSWGGSWMWDDIDFVQETTQDLKWVAEGMQNTLVWTMDGSYNRKRAANLSGVG
jgi:hypothetical protein